jgi:hypothetical protein
MRFLPQLTPAVVGFSLLFVTSAHATPLGPAAASVTILAIDNGSGDFPYFDSSMSSTQSVVLTDNFGNSGSMGSALLTSTQTTSASTITYVGEDFFGESEYAFAGLSYDVEVVGAPGVSVPVILLATVSSTATMNAPVGDNAIGGYASASFQVLGAGFNVSDNTCQDVGAQAGTCSSLIPPSNISSINVNTTAIVDSDTPFGVNIQVGAVSGGPYDPAANTVSTSASVLDPRFEIDPTWAATHPGYSIVLSPGVGSAPPVPEPGAWAMMLVGFGSLGARMRSKRMAVRPA